MPSSGALNRSAMRDQRDRQHLDRDRGAEQDFGISLNLIFVGDLYLRRGAPGDEDNPRRRLARIGVHAGDKIFWIAHGIAASFSELRRQPFSARSGAHRARHLCECARNERR